MKTFINARAVARLIGMTSAHAFLVARIRLEDDLGFPQPLPTCLRPLKWRLDAVQAWISAQGQPRHQAPAEPDLRIAGANVVLMHEAARA